MGNDFQSCLISTTLIYQAQIYVDYHGDVTGIWWDSCIYICKDAMQLSRIRIITGIMETCDLWRQESVSDNITLKWPYNNSNFQVFELWFSQMDFGDEISFSMVHNWLNMPNYADLTFNSWDSMGSSSIIEFLGVRTCIFFKRGSTINHCRVIPWAPRHEYLTWGSFWEVISLTLICFTSCGTTFLDQSMFLMGFVIWFLS